jgi:hypothetical protein
MTSKKMKFEDLRIPVRTEIRNTSDKYLVVGDASNVLSAHDSMEDASTTLSTIDVNETGFAVLQVLPPGKTWTLDVHTPRPKTKAEETADTRQT